MPTMSDANPRTLRGRLAIHYRWHPDDHEGIAALQAELERAKVRQYLQRAPLSAKEITKIAREVANNK